MKRVWTAVTAFGTPLLLGAVLGAVSFGIGKSVSRHYDFTPLVLGYCAVAGWGLCLLSVTRVSRWTVVGAACGLMWGYWGALVVALAIEEPTFPFEFWRLVAGLSLPPLGACFVSLPVGLVARESWRDRP